MPDYYNYLLVRTWKSGRVEIIYSSDSNDAIEEAYLNQCKYDAEEIREGKIRLDIYKWA